MRRLNSRGETIVEVLIIAAVVSLVLGAAFSSTSKTVNGGRQAQERTEGSAVAQDKIERLKTLIAAGPVNETGPFCVTDTNQIRKITDASAATNAVETDNLDNYPAECKSGRYSTFIRYVASENLYTSNVRWDNATGTGRDNVQMKYRTNYIADATADPTAPSSGTPPSGTPASMCPIGIGLPRADAFQACYFNTITSDPCDTGSMSNFALARVEGNPTNGLQNYFGNGSPDPAVDNDVFSGCFEGSFDFDETRDYTFTVTSDDGVRVYIDGVPVLDRFTQQGATSFRINRNLSVGRHTIKVAWYENAGQAVVAVSWADAQSLPRTGMAWVDLATANVSDPRVASGRPYCWPVYEQAAAGEGWENNYLCAFVDLGITWSQSGVLPGQFCYQWLASPEDPDTWSDNYLCANSPLGLTFNKSGAIAGANCIRITEPLDTDGGIWQPSGTANLCESVVLAAEDVVEAETFGPSGGCNMVVSGGYQWCGAGQAGVSKNTIEFQTLVVRARADYHNGWPVGTVRIDGNVVGTFQTNSTSYRDYYITGLNIQGGIRNYSVSFDNDACCGSNPYTDRNLTVDKLLLYRDDAVADIEAESMTTPAGSANEADGNASGGSMKKMYSSGTINKTVTTGRITDLTIRARGDQWQGAPQMTLRIDGTAVGTWDVSNSTYQKFALSGLNIAPGSHTFSVSWANDACGDASNPCGSQPNQDRNLIVDKIELYPTETTINVLAGKTATSSGYEDPTYKQGTPNSAVDGNDNTMWYPGTWSFSVTADSGAARNLTAITSVWQGFGYSYPNVYITNYNIEYSPDGSSWTSAGSGGSPGNSSTTVYGNFVNARYVRVTASSSVNWIGLYEIKAY